MRKLAREVARNQSYKRSGTTDMFHDVKEIAEMENISEKIVYRDIGIACKILAVYLLGM